MAVEFSDLNDAEIRRYCTLLSNKASQLVNGLDRIKRYRDDAERPSYILQPEQVEAMVSAIEAEVRASMSAIAAIEVTPESAREAEAEANPPQPEPEQGEVL